MGRIIAVGDRHQAIYGFRGAHVGSMDELRDRFHMRELPLSISYRCPKSVVIKAQRWVPHIEYHTEAIDGWVGEEGTDWAEQAKIALGAPLAYSSVVPDMTIPHAAMQEASASGAKLPGWMPEGITKWTGIKDFQIGDVILCRLTRPLVQLAFALIRARIPARVLGRDIGQGLVSLVQRVCKRHRLATETGLGAFEAALVGYLDAERVKLTAKGKDAEIGRLEDQVATIQIFMGGADEIAAGVVGDGVGDISVGSPEETVGQLISEIERLFVDADGQTRAVALSTVHKAKGLEWDRVFILDAGELMPWKWAQQDWELDQERNIMYVAATRSKRELRYITSEDVGIFKDF